MRNVDNSQYSLFFILFLLFFFDFYPIFIPRIISIPFSSMMKSIKSPKIPLLINFLAFYQSLCEIRITDIKPTKTNHISPSITYSLDSFLTIERIVPNYDTIKIWAKCFAYVFYLLCWAYCIMTLYCVKLC